MFTFLKQKIKDAVSAITKKFEKEESPVEPGTETQPPTIDYQPAPSPPQIQTTDQRPQTPDQKPPTIEYKPLIPPPQSTASDSRPEIIDHEPKTTDQPTPTVSKPQAPISQPRAIDHKPLTSERKPQTPDTRPQTPDSQLPTSDAKPQTNPRPPTPDRKRVPVEIIKPLSKLEPPKKQYAEEEATGFFGKLTQKITTKKMSKEEFEQLFWDLEVSLLENNVAVEVIDVVKKKLEDALVDKPLRRTQVEQLIVTALHDAIDEVLSFSPLDMLKAARSKRPYVICFVGINGSGKTTTIAKVAHYLKKNKMSCVIAAGDTFRAAAIQQLEEHAKRLEVKLIKHDYKADAAAVAYDAIAYAKAHDIDVVLIDTAGRMHSNVNLMDEMKKIIRVAKPDMTLFVGESITGNDCIEQARQFNETIGISGIVLAKADVDEKGGAALSIAHVTGKPIVFFGMGQGYDDLKPFSKDVVMQNLGLKA